EEEKVSISFSANEKNLIVGDEEYLFPIYDKVRGYTLTYSSDNTSVVTVDGNGKLSALKEGTATVKAKYSNGVSSAEASIKVNSSFGEYIPELKTMGVSSDIAIAVNDGYKMLPYISFNGKQFEDALVSYKVIDQTVAQINENGVILAKAKGQTQVIVEASWRGKDKSTAPTLQKVITLSVIDDVRFYNNGEVVSDELLYTHSEFEGVAYKNSIPCKFQVEVNGQKADASVTVENAQVIKQQGDLLVVNSFGNTNVLVQASLNGETYSKTFNVTVKRVEKTITDAVPLFSTVDGEYLDFNSGKRKSVLAFIKENGQIIDAYQGARALTVLENKILGVESSSQTQKGSASISVGTDKVIYHLTLETFAKVLTSKEDLKSLELSNGKILNGYYELLNDIDASGLVLNHSISGESSFAGVFNGNGYSIKNLSLNAGSSLFGVLNGASATVKNFALVNLSASKAYFLAHDTLNDGLVISDVYIALSASTKTPRGITARTAQNSVMKNVVIEYLGTNASTNRDYSERYNWQGLIGGLWTVEQDGMLYARDSKWSDVYVISPFIVSFRSDEKKDGSNYAALYGYGANEDKDIYGNVINSVTNNRENPNLGDKWQSTLYYNAKFSNLYHYSDYDKLVAAKRDFSTFSGDYWVVIDNKIIWKSLVSENVEVDFYNGSANLGQEAKLIGTNNEIAIKATIYGNQAQIASVAADDECLAWDATKNTLKLVSLPAGGANILNVKVAVSIGNTQIVKTLQLLVAGESTSYSVTLDAGDGRVDSQLTSYVCGEGAILPSCTLEGYAFLGWYENSNFSGDPVTEIGEYEIGDKVYYAKYKVKGSKYSVQVLVAQYSQGSSSGLYYADNLTYVDRTKEYANLLGIEENGIGEANTNTVIDLTDLFNIKGAKINAGSILKGTVLADGSLELIVKLDFDEQELGFKLADLKVGKWSCENLTFTLEYYNGTCGLAIDGTIGNGKELVISVDEIAVANYSAIAFNYYEKSTTTNTSILALSESAVLDNSSSGHSTLISATANPANYISGCINLIEKFPTLTKIKQINVKLLGGGQKHVFIGCIEKAGFVKQTVTYNVENGNLMGIAQPLNGGTLSQVENYHFSNSTPGEEVDLYSSALVYTYTSGTAISANHTAGVKFNLGGIRVSDYKSIKILARAARVDGNGANLGFIYCNGIEIASKYGGAFIIDVKALCEAKGVTMFSELEIALQGWAGGDSYVLYVGFIELELQ
ncbi:MAG: Ig-like domain-containing protein, partial [Clostridia bacterium]|nr:Ig-like domain-containing protein [Clostridia bacterium]